MSDVIQMNPDGDDEVGVLTESILSLVYERCDASNLTLASVVGILECVKHSIMTDHYD